MCKKSIFLIFFISICLSVPAVIKRFTSGFKLAKLHLDAPCYLHVKDPALGGAFFLSEDDRFCPEIQKILSQDFTYLDRGAQCYAFLSKDQKYVLKLFRFDQKSIFKKKKMKRSISEKATQFFESCRLAAHSASDETGLIFLHLNLTQGELPILHARGPLSRLFQVPLDSCRFALQKKAAPLRDVLEESCKTGDLSRRIEEIISLLERRISKGIGNTDPSLWRNFAFLEDRAIEIDFGNYIARPDFSKSANARVELERYMRPLRSWLKKNAPEMVYAFNERLEHTTL